MPGHVPEDASPWCVCHINLARGFRGGERQTELLIRELSARGVAQRLVARTGEPLISRLAGVPGLERIASRGTLSAVPGIGRPDLIHIHEGRSLRSGWLNSLLTRTPYLITRRVLSVPRRHGVNRLLAELDQYLKDAPEALRELIPMIEYRVIPSATSDLRPSPDAGLRECWGGGFVVGHIGALDDADKGQRQIIEVARRLRDFRPELRFVLVGRGPDEAVLRRMAEGVPGVVFAGHSDQVADCLAAFDLFLFPSRREGLGSILLDAMAAGLPVVATRVGGIPELIEDGYNGRLIEAGDVDGLAQAVAHLARDPAARARMGEANRQRAAEFSAGVMAERYLGLYRELTGGPQLETG